MRAFVFGVFLLLPMVCSAQKSTEDCEAEMASVPAAERQTAVINCLVNAASPSPPPPPVVEAKPFKSNPRQAQKALVDGKRAVTNSLKDPESARFRNLKSSGGLFLCGEVNAKNSMGGYTGFKKFYAIGLIDVVTYEDDSQKFLEDWLVNCEGHSRKEIDEIKARLGR